MSFEMNRRNFVSGSAALAAFSSLPAEARQAKRFIGKGWPMVQTMLDDTVRRAYVPGAGGAVARGTDQADFFTSGVTTQGGKTAISPDSLFRAYSMTKPVTGIAAMLLIEDGKMTLDQNIADFLPEFANPRVAYDPVNSLNSRPSKGPITIRTLLTHTAGLGYSITSKGEMLKAYLALGLTPALGGRRPLPGTEGMPPTAPSLKEFSERLATVPLAFDPGVRWSYSCSLDLMGRVIEVVSGMDFEAFLQARLFKPMGMTSSFFQVPDSEKYRMTDNFMATPAGMMLVDSADNSIYYEKPAFAFGGAGLVCSMRDYDRFLAMLMGEGALGKTRIMKRDTALLAMSNLVHPDTKMESFVAGQGFGAGGRVTINSTGAEGVGTFGWAGAASTVGWVDRTRGIRGSGWSQIMTFGRQPFLEDFSKAVYASL